MTAAAELRAAASAIRDSVPPTATFHRATADLLDQIALSAPLVEHQNGASPFLPPITRRALAVARAFMAPGVVGARRAAAEIPAEPVAGAGLVRTAEQILADVERQGGEPR